MQGCKVPKPSYTISEEAIRFQHPYYDPDGTQKLISSSMYRHLSTRNISSKSMHALLSNLTHRQTDRHTDRQTNAGVRAKTYTFSFVGGKLLCCSSQLKQENLQCEAQQEYRPLNWNIVVCSCKSDEKRFHHFSRP